MKKTIYFCLLTFFVIIGCSKVYDVPGDNPEENQLKSARTTEIATPFGMPGDNNDVLNTSLWNPPNSYIAPETYPEYKKENYDLMAHFVYKNITSDIIPNAVVEFTFQNIQYFVPHITKPSEFRTYTVKHIDNQTIITCTTDLIVGPNPMFCFLVKIGTKNNPGLTTFWTDMKVNGVSVKGTIKDKVFDCTPVNGSVSYNYTGGYISPLTCGGVQVDKIEGDVEWHVVDHYENGKLEWSIYTPSGSLTSEQGEVFEIHESDKIMWSKGIYTFHANLIGNQGSHYILSGHADFATWEIVFDKVVCPNGTEN